MDPAAPVRHLREGGLSLWLDPAVAAARGWDGQAAQLGQRVCEVLRATSPTGPGRTLKDDRRSLVRLVDLAGQRWVVKRYHDLPLKAWLYHQVRQTPAWREWRGAGALKQAGVRAATPLALAHEGTPWSSRQALVLPFVDGQTLDAMISGGAERGLRADGPAAERVARQRVARAVGRQIGRLTAAGIINRDHKPTNLIITSDVLTSDAEPVVIDTAGLRPRRDERQVWQMFAVMYRAARRVGIVTPRECLRCLKAALEADGTLLPGAPRRLESAARAVQAIVDARPLSYDPNPGTRAAAPPRKTGG